jgi:hypothetical protein
LASANGPSLAVARPSRLRHAPRQRRVGQRLVGDQLARGDELLGELGVGREALRLLIGRHLLPQLARAGVAVDEDEIAHAKSLPADVENGATASSPG